MRMVGHHGNRAAWATVCSSKENPPVTPAPEPEKKHPPIGPPKRDPQPEPIKDPLFPPSPGTGPDEEPAPIGDPPDKSDHPIRMGFMAIACPVEWPADYPPYKDRVLFNTHSHSRIRDPHDSLERISL
ncbi:hypothetical protein [uncultured Nitrospira sp.]|uniref:hypothetical protein n=1 Tax=uncultured Nitrospira sp. TaxID=157176 RepID=UPI00313FFED0